MAGSSWWVEGEFAEECAGVDVDDTGRWAAFEVKLGASTDTVEAAAAALRAFARNVDTEEEPVLTVITGTGPSYRRADGVNVVAVSSLGP